MRPSEPTSVRAFQALLRSRSLRFATAESCTGGLLARQMTALAGSSEVFWGGVVTYADEAKVRLLGVDPGALHRYGAVSGEVAAAMVRGLLERSGADLAVSITGVAGPGGGTAGKPVGTVWMGVASRGPSGGQGAAVRWQFGGTRAQIQADACRGARILARTWVAGATDLDSLSRLTDNERKSAVVAAHSSFFFPL